MTDKLREAAERTLRWLDSETPTTVDAAYAEERAIAEALRAALAQQPEPVCKCDLRTRLVGDGCEVCNPELAAELAQQPEPVQEPVAWIQPDHLQKARVAPFFCRVEPTPRCADFVPLYTAPPQRPPLTDEEIQELSQQHKFDSRMEKFVRIIERKVRGETE